MSKIRKYTGFSLIELSVVLTIIGLLVGGGIILAQENVEARRIKETREKMEFILTAIDDYVDQWDQKNDPGQKRLPCPADGTDLFSDSTFGIESVSGTDCAAIASGVINVGSSPGISIGMVPVSTLNIPPQYAVDAWNNRFTYIVDRGLVANTGTSNNYGTNIINKTTTNLTVQNTASTPQNITQLAGVVIISHGPDGLGAWGARGGSRASTTVGNTAEAENNDDDATVAQSLPYADGSGEYDDILLYLPKWKLEYDDRY